MKFRMLFLLVNTVNKIPYMVEYALFLFVSFSIFFID